MTADGTGTYGCVPPPVENDKRHIEWFRDVAHCLIWKTGLNCPQDFDDVVVTLNNVAHVLDLGLFLFPLHAEEKKQTVTMTQ